MTQIDEKFIRDMDAGLIAKDVKLFQRPFHVAHAWAREKNLSVNIFDEGYLGPIKQTYQKLYPSGDFSMPSLFVGGVALRDQIYPVKVSVGFGTFSVDPIKTISISPKELDFIFKNYPNQYWRAFYSACDVWDFAYGVEDLDRQGSPGLELLSKGRSSVAVAVRILTAHNDIDSAVQEACLSAELALKGALSHLGKPEADLKKLSHKLPKIVEILIATVPASTDDRLRTACANFPDYVGTRYASHGMNRVQILELAMRAQFVAADAVRRISKRNMGGAMEARSDCPARHQP